MAKSVSPQTIEPQLRRVMRDCRKLYAGCADLMIRQHPTELDSAADDFSVLMEDLHRGLLIKVYTETVRSDGRWTRMEKRVGALMIEHIWDEHLRGDRLRQAAEGLLARSDQLSWESLLAPFVRYRPLRDQVAQVETVVARLANLIAKCDGLTTPEETLTLHAIQDRVGAVFRSVRSTPAGRTDATDRLDGRDSFATGEISAREPTEGETRYLRSPGEDDASRTAKRSPAASGSRREPPDDPIVCLAAAMKELDSLVGLEPVKDRIRSLSNFLQLQRKRQQAGLATMPISLHMAFVGNPGTGKTTVARIVGQILGAMGILDGGHLVETDRSGLVAQYAGQTATKTNRLCDSAIGGVLFIDEAYSLIGSTSDDAYGREAIQTLLKRMEDDRDRLVVILAGYPDEMDQMIRTNPGLSSRINTRIAFDDYSPAELGRIFESLCRINMYRLPPESRHRLLVGFHECYRERDRHFGNGRLARNAFEDCVRRLADRIAGIVPLTDELMTQLTPADIVIPGLKASRIDELLAAEPTLRTTCPHCQKRLRLRGAALGKSVKCPDCRGVHTAAWADVEP